MEIVRIFNFISYEKNFSFYDKVLLGGTGRWISNGMFQTNSKSKKNCRLH